MIALAPLQTDAAEWPAAADDASSMQSLQASTVYDDAASDWARADQSVAGTPRDCPLGKSAGEDEQEKCAAAQSAERKAALPPPPPPPVVSRPVFKPRAPSPRISARAAALLSSASATPPPPRLRSGRAGGGLPLGPWTDPSHGHQRGSSGLSPSDAASAADAGADPTAQTLFPSSPVESRGSCGGGSDSGSPSPTDMLRSPGFDDPAAQTVARLLEHHCRPSAAAATAAQSPLESEDSEASLKGWAAPEPKELEWATAESRIPEEEEAAVTGTNARRRAPTLLAPDRAASGAGRRRGSKRVRSEELTARACTASCEPLP